MALRFGAKIVPFGVVGEDDIGEVRIKICLSMIYALTRRQFNVKWSRSSIFIAK